MPNEKTAVVTGSRRGIGLGIAKALIRAGYRVVLSGTAPEAKELESSLGMPYLPCDISDSASRARFLEESWSLLGRVDAWINNAGVAPLERQDILCTTEESFDRVTNINLKGTYFMCQGAATRMIAALGDGAYRPRIINITSVSAYAPSANRGEYCVSKAGLSMVTKLFAARLAPYGIPVFEVRPGIIQTDMIRPVREKYEQMVRDGLLPLGRLGTPEDVAGCVLAACSGQLDYAAGQVLNADGGFELRSL